MPSPLIDAHPVSDQIYQRIGRVATEWAWIDCLLAEMLAHFCEADHGSMYVITQNVSASTIIDWLRTLTEIRVNHPDESSSQKVILDLLDEIDTVRLERNTVVHGQWSGDQEGPQFGWVQTMRWTRAEVARSEMWSIHDVDDLINHIQQLQTQLANLGLRLGFLTPGAA